MPQEPEDYSLAGNPIYRHKSQESEFEPAVGNEEVFESVQRHVEAHIGPIENVYHELISDKVHLDVLFCPPSEAFPFNTLISCGMSSRPMNAPEGAEHLQYGELVLALPPEWPLNQEDFKEESNYWPIRWLKTLARLPHDYSTWISYGHTIPNGDPPEPFDSSTGLSGWILLSPFLFPEEFSESTTASGHKLHYYLMLPLYTEEMQYKLDYGADALADKLADINISPVIDPKRKNAIKKRGIWPFKK